MLITGHSCYRLYTIPFFGLAYQTHLLMISAIDLLLMSTLEELCDDPFGRRVLLYLLAPRSPTHFSPQFISVLSAGDGNAHSKKDQRLRWEELRGVVIAPLLQLASGRGCLWARSKCHAPLLLQIADSASSKYYLCR